MFLLFACRLMRLRESTYIPIIPESLKMRSMSEFVKIAVVALVILSPCGSPDLDARDHFLVLGGGYSPTGNQVSLERNVIFFRKMLNERFPEGTPVEVFFADGNDTDPDLQYEISMESIPGANRYMAALFGSLQNLNLRYRDHQLPEVDGDSSMDSLNKWVEEHGAQLTPDDRLVLYVTSHGAKSRSKENDFNSSIMLWNNQRLEASELAQVLTRLPAEVPVVMVMVQCFSGGFSHMIFQEALAANGMSDRPICGFFSTLHTRVAAGCTPEINEEFYDEYSSHFWAAIRGRNRMDEPVDIPDYDGDGNISFDEAHAYTLLTSSNIDIPVKTSDAYLREYAPTRSETSPQFLDSQSPFYQLMSLASVSELAVLDGLSRQLDLTGLDRAAEAVQRAGSIEERRKELSGKSGDLQRDINRLRGSVRNRLRNRWPELYNLLTPEAVELVTVRASEFVAAVEEDDDFAEFETLSAQRHDIEMQRAGLEEQWVRYQRFLRVLENVALRNNILVEGDPERISRMEQLMALENSSFDFLRLQPAEPGSGEPEEEQESDLADATVLP